MLKIKNGDVNRVIRSRTGRSLAAVAAAAVMTVAILAPAAGPAAAAGSKMRTSGCTPNTTHMTKHSIDGRRYYVHVPKGIDSAHLPLILAFHGSKQTALRICEYSDLNSAKAVVVYEEGRERTDNTGLGWPPNDKVSDLDEELSRTVRIVHAVEKAYNTDPDRVYATGKSEGAGFIYALACTEPGLLAAIAPVAGAFYRPTRGGFHRTTCATDPLRVLELHGLLDHVMKYDDTVRSAAEKKANPTRPGRSRPIRTVTDPDIYAKDIGFVDEWVDRDGCTGTGEPAPGAASVPSVSHLHWTSCATGGEVEHYEFRKAGHTWPGSCPGTSGGGSDPTSQAVDATATMLKFFDVPRLASPRQDCTARQS